MSAISIARQYRARPDPIKLQLKQGKTAQGNVRQRKAGGGRKGQRRTTEQKLLFCVVYQKAYPLQVLLGEVFEMSQSRANRWIHELLPMLKQALDDLDVLPTREPRKVCPSRTSPPGSEGAEYCRAPSSPSAPENPGKPGSALQGQA